MRNSFGGLGGGFIGRKKMGVVFVVLQSVRRRERELRKGEERFARGACIHVDRLNHPEIHQGDVHSTIKRSDITLGSVIIGSDLLKTRTDSDR